MTASLIDLLDDVLIHLFTVITVPDILTLRLTCKRLSLVSKLRIIWCNKFQAEVQERKLPIPGSLLPLSDISAEDLEWRTRRALRLERQWSVPTPDVTTSLSLDLPEKHVREVMLMPGGNVALTVHRDRISLWEYDHSPAMSQRTMLHSADWLFPNPGSDNHVVRDSALTNHIAIGVSKGLKSSIHILYLGDSPSIAEKGYQCSLPGLLIGLYDNILLMDTTTTTESEDECGILLCHWRDPDARLGLMQALPVYGKYLSHSFFASSIVILWEYCLAVYPLPQGSLHTEAVLDPSQVFRLSQRVQSPVSFTRCQPNRLPDTPSDPLSESEYLTIFAGSAEKIWGMTGGMVRSILYTADATSGALGLAVVPTHVDEQCSALSIGPSGRGVWVENGNVRPCTSRTVWSRKGPIQTADLDDYCRPICRIPTPAPENEGLYLDFDDGMGRIAVACGDEVKIIDVV